MSRVTQCEAKYTMKPAVFILKMQNISREYEALISGYTRLLISNLTSEAIKGVFEADTASEAIKVAIRGSMCIVRLFCMRQTHAARGSDQFVIRGLWVDAIHHGKHRTHPPHCLPSMDGQRGVRSNMCYNKDFLKSTWMSCHFWKQC